MRNKTLAAQNIKPGMIVNAPGVDCDGTDLTTPRQVAKVEKVGPYRDCLITYTCGTAARVGLDREFTVVRSKTQRTATTTHHRQPQPTGLEVTLALFSAYIKTLA